MSSLQRSSLQQVTLVRTRRTRVRDLKGFKRSHQVPSEHNDHTAAFVARIAAEDISEDLDQRFGEFRRQLGFRRVDLNVSDPEAGIGTIQTPWFEYRLIATLAEDDVSEVEWRWQLSEFPEPARLQEPGIAQTFSSFFDTVEFLPAEPLDVAEIIDGIEASSPSGITIDYDRHTTWCSISIQGLNATLTVVSDRLSLLLHQPPAPGQLIEAFLKAQQQFVCRR